MPNITPHVCRHTYCSNMAKSGMNPKTLQYLMGHSDISVTMNVYACIMHVEADFCIITDYKVMVYNQPGVVCSLPNMLSASHYAVYQVLNGLGGSRDWVKNSATSQLIGYDIKTLIHGPGCAIAGDQLEHLSWTLDERELFKSFGPNKERDSHRIRTEISTMDELDQLIDKIIESDRNKEPIKLKK